MYEWLKTGRRALGLFDERDYFLGECALTAGSVFQRLWGSADEGAEIWFDRTEPFHHTVNSAPLLAIVSYARLALHYDRRQYARVSSWFPSLIQSFRRLSMNRERVKTESSRGDDYTETANLSEALARPTG